MPPLAKNQGLSSEMLSIPCRLRVRGDGEGDDAAEAAVLNASMRAAERTAAPSLDSTSAVDPEGGRNPG